VIVRRSLAAVALALSLGGAASGADDQVNIYNWEDYIGRNTIPEFEKQTGIKVVYDTFGKESEVDRRVATGESGYDIVVTSAAFYARQIRAGAYQPLDKTLLPNWRYLDPRILAAQARFDPDNRFAVPYMHGVAGIAFDRDKVLARLPNAPTDSLDLVFKPQIVAHFADCGVTMFDSAEDALELALNYLHLDPNTRRPEDYEQARKLLMAVRPYISGFGSVAYVDTLASGKICLGLFWAGDFAIAKTRAAETGIKVNLAFSLPREGSGEWYDSLLIPKGAPHPAAAHAFLNFLMEPKVIAEITNELHYANGNKAASAFVLPDILNDPALNPAPELERNIYQALETDEATARLRERIWAKIKTGD
jgi:putrescine transport system substrate-binding protein